MSQRESGDALSRLEEVDSSRNRACCRWGKARVGEIQIARHSHCEDELVGLQEAVWQAALSAAKAWQTGD